MDALADVVGGCVEQHREFVDLKGPGAGGGAGRGVGRRRRARGAAARPAAAAACRAVSRATTSAGRGRSARPSSVLCRASVTPHNGSRAWPDRPGCAARQSAPSPPGACTASRHPQWLTAPSYDLPSGGLPDVYIVSCPQRPIAGRRGVVDGGPVSVVLTRLTAWPGEERGVQFVLNGVVHSLDPATVVERLRGVPAEPVQVRSARRWPDLPGQAGVLAGRRRRSGRIHQPHRNGHLTDPATWNRVGIAWPRRTCGVCPVLPARRRVPLSTVDVHGPGRRWGLRRVLHRGRLRLPAARRVLRRRTRAAALRGDHRIPGAAPGGAAARGPARGGASAPRRTWPPRLRSAHARLPCGALRELYGTFATFVSLAV